MTLKDILWISGSILVMIGAIACVKWWNEWRNRTLMKAAGSFGFRRVARGESVPLALVPLIQRAGRTYSIILTGAVGGFEAVFFDLMTSSGKNWDYQST